MTDCDCSQLTGRKLDLCTGVGHDGRKDPRPEASKAFREWLVASGNTGDSAASLAGEEGVVPLGDRVTVSTPLAFGANRKNKTPVFINGGHAVQGGGNLTGGNGDHAEDGGGDNKSHGQSPSGCENCDKARTMTLSDRTISFVKTQAKSAVTGLADQATIDARLAICQQCPHLKNEHCQKCGCACGGGKKYLNKLAHKSSACPDSPPRWGAVE